MKPDEKQNMIKAVDQMINGLYQIKTKIMRDEPLVNEDWVKVAGPLHLNMNRFLSISENNIQNSKIESTSK